MALFALLLLFVVAGVAGDVCGNLTCGACFEQSSVCGWCFPMYDLADHVEEGGRLRGFCFNVSQELPHHVCFNASQALPVNASSSSSSFASLSCLCNASLSGCASCNSASSSSCGWCGTRAHRGVGFCLPLGSWALSSACDEDNDLIQVFPSCPMHGIPNYATYLVSIGGGLLLCGIVALVAAYQKRRHRRFQQQLVSTQFLRSPVKLDEQSRLLVQSAK